MNTIKYFYLTHDILILKDYFKLYEKKQSIFCMLSEKLSFMSEDYPDFLQWIEDKVYPDVVMKKGREIILGVDCVAGVYTLANIAILKDKEGEKKICTFYVMPDYRGQQHGSTLLIKCMQYLQTQKPTITVSGKRIDAFKGIIKKFNFSITKEYYELYKKNETEYVIN